MAHPITALWGLGKEESTPGVITPASTRRAVGPIFGPASGRSVMEHRPYIRPQDLKPLPSHGINTWKPEAEEKPYVDPGPPAPPGLNQPRPEAPLQPLGRDVFYDNASQQNYATQMRNIEGALAPAQSRNQQVYNEFMNYNYSGKPVAALLGLQGIQHYGGALDKLAGEEAQVKKGLIPYDPRMVELGGQDQSYSRRKIFDEGLPTTKANIGLHEAQTEHHKQQTASARPQAALAGYMNDYLASLKPEERNAIVKAQLMPKADKTNTEFDKTVYDLAKMVHEGKVNAGTLDPVMRDFMKSKGLLPVEQTKEKKGYF